MKSADFSDTGEFAGIKASREGEEKKEQMVWSWKELGLLPILPNCPDNTKGSS